MRLVSQEYQKALQDVIELVETEIRLLTSHKEQLYSMLNCATEAPVSVSADAEGNAEGEGEVKNKIKERITHYLHKRGWTSAKQIAADLKLPRSTINFHLGRGARRSIFLKRGAASLTRWKINRAL